MKCYGVTDKGLVRKANQDSYIISANAYGDIFAIVADGIGGGKAGDVASTMATDYLGDAFSKSNKFNDLNSAMTFVRYHVSRVNFQIYNRAQKYAMFKGMGTTLTGVFIGSVGSFVINIGDSRVYGLYDDDTFGCLTNDHTWVMDMVRAGQLTMEEAINHPRKNVITNALGVWSNVRMDIEPMVDTIQTYLICSDGLYGYVPQAAIEDVLKDPQESTQFKLRRLLALALKAGGYDNITIILIEKEKGAADGSQQ